MKTTRILFVVLVISSVLGFTSGQAAVTPVAYYKLGEDDPGATANTPGQNPTQDSSVNNFDLSRSAVPTYRADTAALALGSTLSMEFNGTSDYYYRSTPVTVATMGVGIEAWAKPDAAAAPSIAGYVAYNGQGGNDGYGFIQGGNGLNTLTAGALLDNHWYGLIGPTFVDLGAVTAGQWIHLGMTFDSITGNSSLYVNGVLAATSGTAVVPGSLNPPYARFEIGAYAATAEQFFDGKIDQVRVFTFTGTFNPNDFLITTIPEPSTIMLLGIGGLLLFRRCSRRGQAS